MNCSVLYIEERMAGMNVSEENIYEWYPREA